MTENPDILASGGGCRSARPWCGLCRRKPRPGAGTREKLARAKNVPLIVGNLGPATFGRDDNALLLVDERGERELPLPTSWRWRALAPRSRPAYERRAAPIVPTA